MHQNWWFKKIQRYLRELIWSIFCKSKMTLQIHYRVFPVRYLTMGEIGYLQFSNVTFFWNTLQFQYYFHRRRDTPPSTPPPSGFRGRCMPILYSCTFVFNLCITGLYQLILGLSPILNSESNLNPGVNLKISFIAVWKMPKTL